MQKQFQPGLRQLCNVQSVLAPWNVKIGCLQHVNRLGCRLAVLPRGACHADAPS